MREPYLVDKVCRSCDCMLLRVVDIVECMEHVLDHPVIAVQGKGALEHDCRAVHHPGFHTVGLPSPEIDIRCYQFSSTQRATGTGPALHFHMIAGIAGAQVVDHRTAGRGLLNAPEQVHEHALSRPAPANDADDLAFGNLKGNVV